ncbi:hypothetical protein [Neobacillus niacini]|uniref:hypothetical protein n=1 Tax=Neobacillus niacini TaxID=86668 RepID=UPI002FFE4499
METTAIAEELGIIKLIQQVQGVVYKELSDQTTTIETAMAWRSDESSPAALAFIESVRKSLNQSDNK